MINIEQAKALYKQHKEKQMPRLQKLFNYYSGKHDILNKEKRTNGDDPTKIINNYAKYISTVATGYFIGNPITYLNNSTDNIEPLTNIFKYNFEGSHNADLATDMSIYGVAYELNYIDEEAQYNFAAISPLNTIVITDSKIKPEITDAIIIDEKENADNTYTITLEVYDNINTTTYKCDIKELGDIDKYAFIQESLISHNMGKCPIVEYKNNNFKKSDFEDVISLIDAYNNATSVSLDDLSDFTDAFLCLINMNVDDDTIKELKKSKILNFDNEGKAEWLTKNVNDTYSENIKNRLKQDIHKFSFTPDLTDEAFAGNLSGVAIKCKFQSLEQLRQEKEKCFKKGLYKRLTLINSYLVKYNKEFNLFDIDIKFQTNLPINMPELVQSVNNLTDIVSRKTQLSQIPFVQDVDAELELLEEEKKQDADVYSYEDFNTNTEDIDINDSK